MFQYGLLFDWNPDLFKELSAGIDTTPGGWRVKIRLTRPDEPNAMSSILSMVGDYGSTCSIWNSCPSTKEPTP